MRALLRWIIIKSYFVRVAGNTQIQREHTRIVLWIKREINVGRLCRSNTNYQDNLLSVCSRVSCYIVRYYYYSKIFHRKPRRQWHVAHLHIATIANQTNVRSFSFQILSRLHYNGITDVRDHLNARERLCISTTSLLCNRHGMETIIFRAVHVRHNLYFCRQPNILQNSNKYHSMTGWSANSQCYPIDSFWMLEVNIIVLVSL